LILHTQPNTVSLTNIVILSATSQLGRKQPFRENRQHDSKSAVAKQAATKHLSAPIMQ